MFISRGCLRTILENLSLLNREVEELKKSANFDKKPESAAEQVKKSGKNPLTLC